MHGHRLEHLRDDAAVVRRCVEHGRDAGAARHQRSIFKKEADVRQPERPHVDRGGVGVDRFHVVRIIIADHRIAPDGPKACTEDAQAGRVGRSEERGDWICVGWRRVRKPICVGWRRVRKPTGGCIANPNVGLARAQGEAHDQFENVCSYASTSAEPENTIAELPVVSTAGCLHSKLSYVP